MDTQHTIENLEIAEQKQRQEFEENKIVETRWGKYTIAQLRRYFDIVTQNLSHWKDPVNFKFTVNCKWVIELENCIKAAVEHFQADIPTIEHKMEVFNSNNFTITVTSKGYQG